MLAKNSQYKWPSQPIQFDLIFLSDGKKTEGMAFVAVMNKKAFDIIDAMQEYMFIVDYPSTMLSWKIFHGLQKHFPTIPFYTHPSALKTMGEMLSWAVQNGLRSYNAIPGLKLVKDEEEAQKPVMPPSLSNHGKASQSDVIVFVESDPYQLSTKVRIGVAAMTKEAIAWAKKNWLNSVPLVDSSWFADKLGGEGVLTLNNWPSFLVKEMKSPPVITTLHEVGVFVSDALHTVKSVAIGAFTGAEAMFHPLHIFTGKADTSKVSSVLVQTINHLVQTKGGSGVPKKEPLGAGEPDETKKGKPSLLAHSEVGVVFQLDKVGSANYYLYIFRDTLGYHLTQGVGRKEVSGDMFHSSSGNGGWDQSAMAGPFSCKKAMDSEKVATALNYIFSLGFKTITAIGMTDMGTTFLFSVTDMDVAQASTWHQLVAKAVTALQETEQENSPSESFKTVKPKKDDKALEDLLGGKETTWEHATDYYSIVLDVELGMDGVVSYDIACLDSGGVNHAKKVGLPVPANYDPDDSDAPVQASVSYLSMGSMMQGLLAVLTDDTMVCGLMFTYNDVSYDLGDLEDNWQNDVVLIGIAIENAIDVVTKEGEGEEGDDEGKEDATKDEPVSLSNKVKPQPETQATTPYVTFYTGADIAENPALSPVYTDMPKASSFMMLNKTGKNALGIVLHWPAMFVGLTSADRLYFMADSLIPEWVDKAFKAKEESGLTVTFSDSFKALHGPLVEAAVSAKKPTVKKPLVKKSPVKKPTGKESPSIITFFTADDGKLEIPLTGMLLNWAAAKVIGITESVWEHLKMADDPGYKFYVMNALEALEMWKKALAAGLAQSTDSFEKKVLMPAGLV